MLTECKMQNERTSTKARANEDIPKGFLRNAGHKRLMFNTFIKIPYNEKDHETK